MPAGTERSCEGFIDKNPIQLQLPVTVHKLDHLLEWFYSQYGGKKSADFSLEALDAILELASFLQIESARAFALETLSSRTFLPACRLLLTQRHRILGWFGPAFIPDAAQLSGTSIHLDDYKELDMRNLHILHDTRASIHAHRLAVAFTAPAVHHDPSVCVRMFECADRWTAAWWGGLARHCLHPESPSSVQEVLTKLELATMPRVTRERQRRSILHVAETKVL